MVGVTRHLTGDLVVMDVPHATRNYRTRDGYCNTQKKICLFTDLFLVGIICNDKFFTIRARICLKNSIHISVLFLILTARGGFQSYSAKDGDKRRLAKKLPY